MNYHQLLNEYVLQNFFAFYQTLLIVILILIMLLLISILMFHKKQKSWVKRNHLVTDHSLHDRKAFIKLFLFIL